MKAILASVALFCALALPAAAHQLSDSFLILEVTNAQIIGHWDIAVKDLLHAKGLDPLDQKFKDLRSWDPETEMKAVDVLSRLKIRIDGAPAEIKPVDYSTELYNDGPYAAMYFEINLPKNPRLLEVEYHLFFDVDPAHRGLLILSSTIRNRAPFALAYPFVELTLSDAQDQIVVRRAFAPEEYLSAAADPRGGIAGNSELAVKLFIDASATTQAGYQVYLFYP